MIWTHGGLDKLEIYRELGVGEVWTWNESKLLPWVLGPNGFELSEQSRLLPDIDLAAIARYAELENQTQAVRLFRTDLRAPRES